MRTGNVITYRFLCFTIWIINKILISDETQMIILILIFQSNVFVSWCKNSQFFVFKLIMHSWILIGISLFIATLIVGFTNWMFYSFWSFLFYVKCIFLYMHTTNHSSEFINLFIIALWYICSGLFPLVELAFTFILMLNIQFNMNEWLSASFLWLKYFVNLNPCNIRNFQYDSRLLFNSISRLSFVRTLMTFFL